MQNKQDINQEIAARVRELSTASLAEALGVTEEQYCVMESGSEDLSASCLNEIARILNVDLALLLTGKESRMNTFTVTRAGKGISVQRRSAYQYQALAANFSGKKGEPFLVTCPVTAPDAPVHQNSHPGQEMDYILEGSLKVVICGNEVILNPGDTIFFDSNYPHGMAAVGNEPARFIAIIM